MQSNGANDRASCIYLGLAGETGRGRVVDSGLFRMADSGGEWEALQRGLPEKPAVRALAVHPQQPEIVYAGTQSGPYRSADRGDHWEKVERARSRPAGLVGAVPPARSRRDPGRLRELRDLPQRRCRRALDPAAGQCALSGDHHRTRRQPGQARPEDGRLRPATPS